MRRSRLLLSALAVLLVVAATGSYLVWRAVRPPVVSAFYDAPDDVSGPPGRLLRTQPLDAPAPGARAWRVLYTSTASDGTPVAVSGSVLAPSAPAPDGGYPVVVVAHGTVGIAQGCAPSLDLTARVDDTTTLYDYLAGQYVGAGYAVVMSDLQGLGVAGPSSYLVGDVEGRNVLDSARALLAFPELTVRRDVLLSGQSQGGHAALFAAQLAATYAPELEVVGLVALAPATGLRQIFLAITSAEGRGGIVALPVMAADAYARAYPQVDLGRVLTTRGRGALDNVVRAVCLFPALLGTQLARPQDLLRPGGLDLLDPYIRRNTPGSDLSVPVFLGQGGTDVVVPEQVNVDFAARLCASGVDLTSRRYPAAGHFDVVPASTADVLAWSSAVRAGAAPPTTCPG